MSDYDDRNDDARREDGHIWVRMVNAYRLRRALTGEPGDPPELICEECLEEECECIEQGGE